MRLIPKGDNGACTIIFINGIGSRSSFLCVSQPEKDKCSHAQVTAWPYGLMAVRQALGTGEYERKPSNWLQGHLTPVYHTRSLVHKISGSQKAEAQRCLAFHYFFHTVKSVIHRKEICLG